MKYKYNIFHDDEGIDADAVQISCADFFALKTASGLIPTQWYLLTDYRTIAPILGSNPLEYHTGEVEQIYVQALDVNKVSTKAYSKTYPDEVLTFNGEQYTYLYEMYNSGDSDNGFDTFDITATGADTLLFDTETLDDIDVIDDFYAYIEPNSGIVSFIELTSQNYNDYWTYNKDTNTLTIKSVDVEFSDVYSGGSSSSITFIPTGTETLQIVDGGNLTDMVNGSIYIESNSENIEYTKESFGTDWSWDGTTLTDLTGLMDFEDINLYIEYSVTTKENFSSSIADLIEYFYAEILYSYPSEYTTNGLIIARENPKKGVYIQSDYRGRLFRRYKAQATDWIGTGTYGTTYRYNGFIYKPFSTTSSTPSTSSTDWLQIGEDINFLGSAMSCSIGTIGLDIDVNTYADYEMFSTVEFDYSESVINISVKQLSSKELNIVFLGGITGSTNTEISATNATVIQNIIDSKANIVGGTIKSMSNSSIKSASSVYLKYITNSDLIYALSTYITHLNNVRITYINNCTLRSSIFSCSDMCYLSTCNFIGNVTANIVSSMSTVNLLGDFSYNRINNMYSCIMSGDFLGNTINYYTYYVNFLDVFSRNLCVTSVYGSSNTQRSTFGYTTDNKFFGNVGLNFFSAGTTIVNNGFMSSLSNNHSYSNPANGSSRIQGNTFMYGVSYLSGTGLYEIERNTVTNVFESLVFNNGNTYAVKILDNDFINGFDTITFSTTGAEQVIEDIIRFNADTVNVKTERTIANYNDPGIKGDICWDDTYIYVCVDTDTWHRVEHAEW